MKPSFDIAGRPVGAGKPALVVGEVAQSHDGSLGIAHAFVDAIADAGADVVKFQTHIAAAESTPSEPWRTTFSAQDATRYDYWRRMELDEEQWRGLAQHAQERGLIFLSSPFSLEAVDLLERVGVPAWKVGSGEVGNAELLDRMARSKLPVILSSGMSSWAELDRAVERLASAAGLAVLQCTSAYPVAPDRVGLNLITALQERYGCPAGLSDHSGTIYPCLAATVLGATVLEVHVTLSPQMFGPDVPASVTPAELAQLVAGVRFIEEALAYPVDKDALAGELAPMRELFTKSLVARIDLEAGTVIAPEHLAAKKPGTGIPAERLPELVGRKLRRALRADDLVAEEDVE